MDFIDCLFECASNNELVAQFNRLYNCQLGIDNRSAIEKMVDSATGYQEIISLQMERDLKVFIQFVYDCIWLPVVEISKES